MIARVRLRSLQDRKQLWEEFHGLAEPYDHDFKLDHSPSFILIDARPMAIWDSRYFGNCPGPIWRVAEKSLEEMGLNGPRFVCAHDVEVD